MAIAFDAQSNSAYKGAGTSSVTWSHTCTGSDRLLVVGAYCGNSGATSVTYNGASMTEINSLAMSGPASGQYIRLYYLVNPASGTNNCVMSSGTSTDNYGAATSYTGVKQTGQPDANNTNGTTSSSAFTTSLTTTADNCWLVGFSYMGLQVVAGTNTTLRSTPVYVEYMMDNNAAQTPAGSHSLQTTAASATFAGHVIASFSPTLAPTTNYLKDRGRNRAVFTGISL
jgi:hypothetical protein